MLALIPLLAAGANVTLYVSEVVGVRSEVSQKLNDQLIATIEARTRDRVRLEPKDNDTCTTSDRCLDELRARTGADELLLVGYFGGLTKLRLIAERVRFGEHGIARDKVELDGPAEPSLWRRDLEELAVRLFPEPVVLRGPDPLSGAPFVEKPPPKIAPWIFAGTAIAALGASIAFGASSLGTKNTIEGGPHSSAELESLTGRMNDHALICGIFAGAAAALAITGAAISIE